VRGLFCFAWIAVGCGGPAGICDGAEAALASAAPGDVVTLGSCEVAGPLHVPPGVTLEGTIAGSFRTVVVAPEDSGGIIALGGDDTTIRNLSVRVEGRIGILVRGGGTARIENLIVDAERGIAIGAVGLDALTITGSTLDGPIDEANASDPMFLRVIAAPLPAGACPAACDCDPGDVRPGEACDAEGRWATITATHGLYAQDIAALRLEDIEVEGFAEHGVVVRDSTTTFVGGGIADTLGIGLQQIGGVLALDGVDVVRTYAGLRGLPPVAVSVSRAAIDLRDVSILDNDRYGVILVDAPGRIDGFFANGNDDVALWIGGTNSLTLASGVIGDNGFGGLVVSQSSGVHVESTTIEGTRAREYALGAFGVVRLGDGLHVHESFTDIRFTDVQLNENERVGAVIDLGASGIPDVRFTDVEVRAFAGQLGAIAGRTSGAFSLASESPPGWDDGIVRIGDAIAADAAFSGDLAAIDLLAPSVPDPDDAVMVVAPMF
jgi:hypothetical protein